MVIKVKIKILIFFVLVGISTQACQKKQSKSNKVVEVKNVNGDFKLFRHGEPYYIKGGGGVSHFKELKNIGGNSIRTWSLHNAQEILDEAEKNGLTVTLGIEIGKQAWGEEFNYWNLTAVNEKVEEIREVILKYKDHPALLMWGVGNEVHLFGGNRIMVTLLINKISKMIHEVDPNHPVMTTTTAGIHLNKYGFLRILCPNLDVLGINAFERLAEVHADIRSPLGWNKPYIITEFGTIGPWESKDTPWGAPQEKSTTESADYTKDYWNLIKNDTKFSLGGYAFYWGHKFEVTNTWFSLFSKEGYRSEIINNLQEAWIGEKSVNNAPRINKLKIESYNENSFLYLGSDDFLMAEVEAHDPENNSLNFDWEIRADGESAHVMNRHSYIYEHLIIEKEENKIKFKVPSEVGSYRLFVFVYDNNGNFAASNRPFYVINNKI